MPKGAKYGGRTKGTPNKQTLAVKERIAALGGDYVLYLVKTMNNQIPCSVCRGKGKTPFQPLNGADPGNRTCQSCWGSKLEKLAPKESAWAAAELMSYCEAKRKAIDLTGTIGVGDIAAQLIGQRWERFKDK